jgi:UDP-N-acetylmuramoyl-tripeptide--D-alanyl-D-alanine ligase
MNLSLSETALIMKGRLEGSRDLYWTGVSIDTRTLNQGDLFFALQGDLLDGHDFIKAAFSKGCSAAVVQADFPGCHFPLVRVENTLEALQKLACHVRATMPAKVVAITGSHGKTTTKDFLAAILGTHFSTLKTQKNLNGLIGVPLTVLNLKPEHQIAVIEVGISKPGEMDILGPIVRPDAVIFTCVAPSHTEFLNSVQNIRVEKNKLFHWMKPGGKRVLNGDDPLVMQSLEDGQSITYGTHSCDFQGIMTLMEPGTTQFKVIDANRNQEHEFSIPLPGRHNMMNSLAAIAAASALGVPFDQMQAGLSSPEFSPHRSQIIKIHDIYLIDDAYNAAPKSMESSLKMLKEIAGRHRAIAVLGDMLELGPESQQMHEHIGELVAEYHIEFLFGFGELMKHACRKACELGANAIHLEDCLAISRILMTRINPGDVILLKASRGMRAERIIDDLKSQIDAEGRLA